MDLISDCKASKGKSALGDKKLSLLRRENPGAQCSGWNNRATVSRRRSSVNEIHPFTSTALNMAIAHKIRVKIKQNPFERNAVKSNKPGRSWASPEVSVSCSWPNPSGPSTVRQCLWYDCWSVRCQSFRHRWDHDQLEGHPQDVHDVSSAHPQWPEKKDRPHLKLCSHLPIHRLVIVARSSNAVARLSYNVTNVS